MSGGINMLLSTPTQLISIIPLKKKYFSIKTFLLYIWDAHKIGETQREMFKCNATSLFVYYFIINDSNPMILFVLRYVIEDPEDLWFMII